MIKTTEGYYITNSGKKVIIPFHNESYYCDSYSTHNLGATLQDNVTNCMRLEIHDNDIVELAVPEGYFSLYCDNNVIQILHLPDTIIYCCADNNNISKIFMGESLDLIELKDNPLSEIIETPISRKKNKIMSHIHCSIDAPINPFDYPKLDFKFY